MTRAAIEDTGEEGVRGAERRTARACDAQPSKLVPARRPLGNSLSAILSPTIVPRIRLHAHSLRRRPDAPTWPLRPRRRPSRSAAPSSVSPRACLPSGQAAAPARLPPSPASSRSSCSGCKSSAARICSRRIGMGPVIRKCSVPCSGRDSFGLAGGQRGECAPGWRLRIGVSWTQWMKGGRSGDARGCP